MIPPPPPPRSFRLPPPPPKPKVEPWFGDEPEFVPVSPDLSRFDLEGAIWIHGGYPQVPWAQAARNLLAKCRKTSFGHICAGAIWILDRDLPADCDLTADRHFDFSATADQPINRKD